MRTIVHHQHHQAIALHRLISKQLDTIKPHFCTRSTIHVLCPLNLWTHHGTTILISWSGTHKIIIAPAGMI
jgi:hypothetical protein